jgi:dCMP deaminase
MRKMNGTRWKSNPWFHNFGAQEIQGASLDMLTDYDLLQMAYAEAINYSTDPSTQNGAVIKCDSGESAFGANHFPKGVKESPERWERPAKYAWVEHAERNAVFYAARHGIKTYGATMYCPWFACADCARAIIQAGIKEVVGHETSLHAGGSQSWKDSIAIAYKMFEEAGVKFRHIPGTFNHKIRFNGELREV